MSKKRPNGLMLMTDQHHPGYFGYASPPDSNKNTN